ncbi:MAG: zinc ribbon domain-containing protein, partial [Actinomycetota bacterium]|nr:zinc ribbon domain-containing protein [Actinomycetota bacterium]
MASNAPHPEDCSQCGHRAAPDDRFCAECGSDLAVRTCPSCAASNDVAGKFCTGCGTALAGDSAVIEAPDQRQADPPIEAGVPTVSALEVATAVADEGHPAEWKPAGAFEVPDIRTPIPESVVGDPMPFEPRRVPPTGMAAWSQPDAATQPEAQLAGGTDLLLIELRGSWAYVMADNGWRGWVDDRLLVDPDLLDPPGAPPPALESTPPPSARTGLVTRPLTAAGAITAVVAVFVPWISSGIGFNAFDVPVAMLFNVTTADSSFSVGIVLLALGGSVAAIALVPKLAKLSNLLRPLGIGLVAVGGLFIYQLASDPILDLADYLGAGSVVAIAAGVLVLTKR